jgi:hypothetical protein
MCRTFLIARRALSIQNPLQFRQHNVHSQLMQVNVRFMMNRTVNWRDPWSRIGCICFLDSLANWSYPPMRNKPVLQEGIEAGYH